MSQEKTSDNEKKLLENINRLLVDKNSALPHDVSIDPDDPDLILRVWVKDLSFIESQQAIKEVVELSTSGEVSVNIGNYWKFMFTKCIDRTEPALSKAQILALKPEYAIKIAALLPQPEDLVAGPLGDGASE